MEEINHVEGEQKYNPSVWNTKRDWTKHFVQNNQNRHNEHVAENGEKREKTAKVEKVEDPKKITKETTKEETKPVVEESKPSETEKVVEEIENLKIDSSKNNPLPSNETKTQTKPKVYLPSIDINNEYDQQLNVTFGGKIPTTTNKEETIPEQAPVDPNQMVNFPPNESNQFVIPPNNMNFRYPMYHPPMYSQPMYPNEFPNEMGWDGYPYPMRNPRNNGKKGYRGKSQPKRNSKFPSHFKQMGDPNEKTNINENVKNNTDFQDINQNKNINSDPIKSDNMNGSMADHYAMYRTPEQFAPFYGNNLFSVHNGMMIPPYYNQYPPQMYPYYPPPYDNNFENNQFPPQN